MEINRLGNIYGEDKGTGYAGNVWDKEGLCPTLTTMAGGNREPMITEQYRIRKLTPKECTALMGFTEEDAEKMLEVNSNTQVYKQCGNSICVSVLEAIFCQMNIKDCPTWEERAKEEYL